eukprot:UN27433
MENDDQSVLIDPSRSVVKLEPKTETKKKKIKKEKNINLDQSFMTDKCVEVFEVENILNYRIKMELNNFL